ncbi:hypothetical protein KSC_038950 [Ktedonobacter sp. SOSP1-52]|uniref:sensor histidine kinase n=1 Tax=Ktedonobacter sp. SOSP1-52 TaxID=2778366 RepID=UPI001916C907|nr:HAMP domain-containing sensor histidine kinase [Ktedonobacter sp. SOSP1-52]GHO65003.1 hypothetical protein KSC_038950 [Ktedonobacter sp. SOSP1-52]
MSTLSQRTIAPRDHSRTRRGLYIPLHLRLACFYTLLLIGIFAFFGIYVYQQARQQAYQELDNALSTRAASIQLGKDLSPSYMSSEGTKYPLLLPGDNGIGIGGISIEILSTKLQLLATTTGVLEGGTSISHQSAPPAPWDEKAAQAALRGHGCHENTAAGACLFSTITYNGQTVRVYTLRNDDPYPTPHIIQTARSTDDVEQSLAHLRQLILEVSLLALLLALLGGWLIARGVLSAVRRLTLAAQTISASSDFSKRVYLPNSFWRARDELSILSETFNQMLTNLEEAYLRQQRFVADASHELRAPITSIRCNLDLLNKAPDLPGEEISAALTDTQAEAERLGRLVNDLLTLARADSTQQLLREAPLTLYHTRIDLDSLLLDTLRLFRHRSGQTSIYPRLLLQHTEPVQIYGDADQLKQVLVALVDNAFKYTPPEGTITLSLRSHEHRQACIVISDTGIGIPAEDLPHIFERFYRADPARSRDRGGSGLGLAIVKRIIENHQGNIQVESTPGAGSSFTLCFPSVPIAPGEQA